MYLKSSEVNICSWNITAVLISFFAPPPADKRAFQRSSEQQIMWKLKKILDPPEFNCSVVLSLYYLSVSKKMDYFLRNLVRNTEEFPGSTSIHFLSFIGIMLGKSSTSSLLVVWLLPLIWLQQLSDLIVTLILQEDVQNFCTVVI